MQPSAQVQSPFIQQPPSVQLVGPTKTPPIFDPSYVAVLDYFLKIEVPKRYQPEFDKYKPALSQALMLANIEKGDVIRYRDMFKSIIKAYHCGLPENAREWILELIVELALTRSIKGFQQHEISSSRYVAVTEGLPAGRESESHRRKRFLVF